ncbi:transglycosylase SLT domain-containing protein [Streptomyces sp. Y1]|uniref:Transglycosylase SLT domain-containing protein n=1 Tax=Streptomyces sp. Y1 TaxID=3238634 RepID=A0AB39TX50_9ACTN
MDTDQWIGQYCVNSSGTKAVVVYGPRQAANHEQSFHQGGLAAVVDLGSGAVTKLPDTVSMAYHNPGCGDGDQAVLSRLGDDRGRAVTTLMLVDTTTGAVVRRVGVPGQVTSAVARQGRIAAASGTSVVSVDHDGSVARLTDTHGTPARLATGPGGELAFEVTASGRTEVHRLAQGQDQVLATAGAGEIRLRASRPGITVVGPKASALLPAGVRPAGWHTVDAPSEAEVSTDNALVVTSASNKDEAAGRMALGEVSGGTRPVRISAVVPATGANPAFVVLPAAQRPGDGAAASPARPAPAEVRGAAPAAGPDPAGTTIDVDRACAVPRNDPKVMSLQPSPQMAEWAIDLAVQGQLTVPRPAGWNGSPLAAYTPQGLFPSHDLSGGGRVPAQIMLGIAAQESNMWQASQHAVDGESGNFEQGGFYGNHGDNSVVDFSQADCGYGMMQVTDGMRVPDRSYTQQQQLAIAVDYAANAAAGLQILQDKWNQTRARGLVANDGDPKYLENWWFALWAYNTGYHEQGSDASGAYGLGWTNNPGNPDYPADRKVFLSATRDDAKTPNHWSYPERVIGWAAYSLLRYDFINHKYVEAFSRGHWANLDAPQ